MSTAAAGPRARLDIRRLLGSCGWRKRLDLRDEAVNKFIEENPVFWEFLTRKRIVPVHGDKPVIMRKDMDAKIRKIEKTTRKAEKELKGLEKADKKRDKQCDAGKRAMAMKKKKSQKAK